MRDYVVSQCHKFVSAFISYFSWEQKLAFFYLTFLYPVPVKKFCDFHWLQLRIRCKSGWIAQAEKSYCVSKERCTR